MWTTSGLQSVDRTAWRVTEEWPTLRYTGPLNIPLSQYTHLYLKAGASAEMFPRGVTVLLQTEAGEHARMTIPLVADQDLHAYIYPLALANLKGRTVTSLAINPIRTLATSRNGIIRITELRLVNLQRQLLEARSQS